MLGTRNTKKPAAADVQAVISDLLTQRTAVEMQLAERPADEKLAVKLAEINTRLDAAKAGQKAAAQAALLAQRKQIKQEIKDFEAATARASDRSADYARRAREAYETHRKLLQQAQQEADVAHGCRWQVDRLREQLRRMGPASEFE